MKQRLCLLIPSLALSFLLSSCVSFDKSHMADTGLRIPEPGEYKANQQRRRKQRRKEEWNAPFPKPEFLDKWEKTWDS